MKLDYSDNAKNLGINPSWNKQEVCDSTRWEGTNCNGVAVPWAFGSVTAPTTSPVANGKVRAWHFLADAATDKSSIWSIEKSDVLNFFIHEFVPPNYDASRAAAAYAGAGGIPPAYLGTGDNDKFRIAWDVKTFTVTGATSTVLGAAAIVAGVIASMF